MGKQTHARARAIICGLSVLDGTILHFLLGNKVHDDAGAACRLRSRTKEPGSIRNGCNDILILRNEFSACPKNATKQKRTRSLHRSPGHRIMRHLRKRAACLPKLWRERKGVAVRCSQDRKNQAAKISTRSNDFFLRHRQQERLVKGHVAYVWYSTAARSRAW